MSAPAAGLEEAVTEKACGRCKVVHPLAAFARNPQKRDGLSNRCRDCQRILRKDWADRKRLEESGADVASALPVAVATAAALTPVTDAVDTAPTETHAIGAMMILDHSAIVPSLTNPRKHFDAEFLKGLSANIKARGLAQPILVRRLPGARMGETYTDRRADAPRPTHEIVAGEQRWRACGMAGVRKMPALIRDLSDEEVLELQLVENLKRRDLHPMEEAEGYQRLRETAHITVEQIAERIDKGPSYVYKTLKLLDLEPEAREAFYEGKLTRSTAELIAVRTPNLQIQLLKEITAPDFHGEPMSFRKAKAHVEERYMLRLGSAPFKITSEVLLPEAGSCKTCPKRTGSNPQLFDDVSHADTCTDPGCFAKKKDAHYDRVREAAKAKGQEVIFGKEAKEIMPDSNTLRGYTKVDDHQAFGGQMKTLRKVLGSDMPTTTLLEDPQTHEMVEVLSTAVVGKLLKDQGLAKPPAVATSEAEAKRRGLEKLEKSWRRSAIKKIDEVMRYDTGGGMGAPVLRLFANFLVDDLTTESRNDICALLELGKVAPREAIESHVDGCDEGEVLRALMLLLVHHDMRELVSGDKASASTRIQAVAKDLGVDIDAIKAEAKAAMKREASAAKVDAAAGAVKAAAPAPRGKAPLSKPTLEEFNAKLATALGAAPNPNAFTAGQRVRIKVDLRRGSNVLHTSDTTAEILGPLGDRAWNVQPDNLSFPLSADYTELEAIES
ncbi:hypothetical protein BH10PSE18_BH10PSE18_14990 [soil metagenome]